jgi:hypothetical protein
MGASKKSSGQKNCSPNTGGYTRKLRLARADVGDKGRPIDNGNLRPLVSQGVRSNMPIQCKDSKSCGVLPCQVERSSRLNAMRWDCQESCVRGRFSHPEMSLRFIPCTVFLTNGNRLISGTAGRTPSLADMMHFTPVVASGPHRRRFFVRIGGRAHIGHYQSPNHKQGICSAKLSPVWSCAVGWRRRAP